MSVQPNLSLETIRYDGRRLLAPGEGSGSAELRMLYSIAAREARLAGQKERYTAWSLQLTRSDTRSHGSAVKPAPLIADLSNAEIESVAAHLSSLR